MTLAKTCHASSMMQDLIEATCRPVGSTKAFWITMFKCSIIVLKKMNLMLKLKAAMLNEKIWHLLHIVLLQILSATFLPNIV